MIEDHQLAKRRWPEPLRQERLYQSGPGSVLRHRVIVVRDHGDQGVVRNSRCPIRYEEAKRTEPQRPRLEPRSSTCRSLCDRQVLILADCNQLLPATAE